MKYSSAYIPIWINLQNYLSKWTFLVKKSNKKFGQFIYFFLQIYKLCCVSFSYQHTLMAIYNYCILHFGKLVANLSSHPTDDSIQLWTFMLTFLLEIMFLLGLLTWLIAINHIHNKILCLHICVYCAYLYVYINTHTHTPTCIYLRNIYMYMYVHI